MFDPKQQNNCLGKLGGDSKDSKIVIRTIISSLIAFWYAFTLYSYPDSTRSAFAMMVISHKYHLAKDRLSFQSEINLYWTFIASSHQQRTQVGEVKGLTGWVLNIWFCLVIVLYLMAIGGGQGSKNDVWLFLKISMSLSCCFLQNVKINFRSKVITISISEIW